MTKQSPLRITYKALAVALILYALIFGLTAEIPVSPQMGSQLGQSARNLLYHVPNWFAMIVMMGISLYHSIRVLRLTDPDRQRTESPLRADIKANEAARVGVMFNVFGLLTGILWSRVSWNEVKSGLSFSAWWGWDPIQTCALIALLIYLAYYLLRNSIEDPEQKAKVSAVYNIFAFMTLIPLFFIIPRILQGLHPTADGGDVLFKREGMNSLLRMILYPGMLGFILMGIWIYEVRSRTSLLHFRWQEWRSNRDYAQSQQS
ncbi:MAG: cytochrome c biogenesis protein CcsA [Bacteroidota bacterium]